MDQFCGSPFWDPNVTWHTDNPDFTECFENTALIWSACGFLWIAAIFEICLGAKLSYSSSSDRPSWLPAWTRLGVMKIFSVTLLICLEVALLWSNWAYKTSILAEDDGPAHVLFPVAMWTATLALIATHFLSAGLIIFHKTQCIHTSGTQLIHWSLMFLVRAIIFRTNLTKYLDHFPENNLTSLILLGVITSVKLIQLILFCWSDIPNSDGRFELLETEEEECPMTRISCLSYILFSWVTPMVRKGYNVPLSQEDLWRLVRQLRSPVVFQWFNQSYGTPKFGESRGIFKNVLKPLWNTCGCPFIIGMLCEIIATLLMYLSPTIMGFLIDFVNEPETETWKGYMWASVLILINLMSALFQEQFYLLFNYAYSNILSCLNMKVYRKSLNVTHGARKETTFGEIVNLMSVDVEKIRGMIYDANIVISSIVSLVAGIILLWMQLGYALLPGLGLLLILIPLNWYLSKLTTRYQEAQMSKKDERIKIISEALSAMQVVKLYAWEPSFQEQIMKIREEELILTKKKMYISCFMKFTFTSIPFLTTLASFITFIYVSDGVLDAKKIFVTVSLFNMLTTSLTWVPTCISDFIDALVSVKRINKFLNSEEFHPEAINYDEPDNDKPAVEIKNGTFSWEEMTTSNWKLSNINLGIQPKTLTAIVGSVASGKSSLLSAILGEMKYSGNSGVTVRGRIAYVPQVAWILNATLRENICFGLEFHEEKYEKIIEACCLIPDLEILPAGDMTEIGEKGINLSGGQKQRVSLARAVYSCADILLLDDVLSAVDAHVAKHIFDRLLGPTGLLARKTRILCTHAYNFLSQVDHVLVVDGGQIIESGSYDQLMTTGGNFSLLLASHIQSKESVDIKEDEGKDVEDEEKKKKTRGDQNGNLIGKEGLETGDVKLSVFMGYIRSLGYLLFLGIVISTCLSEGLSVGRNVVLAKWSDQSQVINETGTTGSDAILPYLIEYVVFGVFQSLFCFLAYFLLAIAAYNAASVLHTNMLSRILHAPMAFFNVTPLGRITNRFSSDIDTVDRDLPIQFTSCIVVIFRFIGIIAVVTYTNGYFLVTLLPLAIIYFFLQRYYILCMQQLQRLMNCRKSPIYALFQESLNGTSSIRAYKAEDRFTGLLGDKIDDFNRALFPHQVVRRWLSIRLGVLGSLVVAIPAAFAVIWRDTLSPSLVGLSITYSMNVIAVLSNLIKVASYLQYSFVSVERILEYTKVDQEAEYETFGSTSVGAAWPESGEIRFNNFETRYRPGLDLVLKNFSCAIQSGEKIGIVGRTGAGKSSLTLALFRIIEATAGSIVIDGLNIADLGLFDLRKRLTVIPQEPVLFSRELRLNLDPFGEYSDNQLWEALSLAHLKPFVEEQPEGLSYPIAEGGENLSVGQRQLVCLARAILRKSTILVLDEATASVDSVTDELIQKTIREHFVGCTILNVAHRLNTVLDSTRILVLGRGEILEFDTPQALLANENSHFYGMAKDAGIV